MNNPLISQAYNYLIVGNYKQAQSLYEQLISDESQARSHYWYLGLCLLLQGQEEEAQMTWISGMEESDYDLNQVNQWIEELTAILEVEALRQVELRDHQISWVVRQHIREINPSQIDNLLQLILLSIEINNFDIEELNTFGLIELMRSSIDQPLDHVLLLKLLTAILEREPTNPLSVEFISLCSRYFILNSSDFINVVKPTMLKVGFSLNNFTLAEKMARACLELQPQNLELLSHLAAICRRNLNYSDCIETANLYFSLANDLPNRITATYLILESLMASGEDWESIFAISEKQIGLVQQLIKENPDYIDPNIKNHLYNSIFFLAYLQDSPQFNHVIQHQISSLCQANLKVTNQELLVKYKNDSYRSQRNSQKIKIGYISACLRRHSVGWLARWVFQYHDRDKFLVHTYSISPIPNETDSIQGQIAYYSEKTFNLDANVENIANQIHQDQIDILIDLDSVTGSFICEVMALKPAPIQVTWLGFDASGIPAIDYFIADPYVLPLDAQEYYAEKIWRLPHTYIAVDGFEASIPTLSREELNISDEAIIYFCAQSSYKRNPESVHLQMQIIKSVPNSYFLIKGWGDKDGTEKFFTTIAEQEGVGADRLRFIPLADSEAEHRANLRIADIVLDTYPYNGATTTMETLWMCIPLVTRVGQQFASRNSYTMMMNAGVMEGIAWTDEEYIEWGVKLGKDANLRKQIFWKLKESRKKSPLWNAKQFTQDMEDAYQQMWDIYGKECHAAKIN